MECELIEAQNSLLSQSSKDARGESNLDGWGLGTYHDGIPRVVRQSQFVANSQNFRREAAKVHTTNVVAHVRRATVGVPKEENTHPFTFHSSIMAHNGTVELFPVLRPYILELMVDHHRKAIRGKTDSEHIFHLFLSLREQFPKDSMPDVLRRCISDLVELTEKGNNSAELALNIILTNGNETVGSRYGRKLYVVHRKESHCCQMCEGVRHVKPESEEDYRAVVIASETICNDEEWEEIADSTVWHVDRDIRLTLASL